MEGEKQAHDLVVIRLSETARRQEGEQKYRNVGPRAAVKDNIVVHVKTSVGLMTTIRTAMFIMVIEKIEKDAQVSTVEKKGSVMGGLNREGSTVT